jgi:AcrR family transcriptional regulator
MPSVRPAVDGAEFARRQAILDAAMAELVAVGIDNFAAEGIAERAGVDPAVIRRDWGDHRVLLMDAQLSRARQSVPTPDTGSLAGDLAVLAESLDQLAGSHQWRQWFHRLHPGDGHADLSEVRSDFWHVRFDEVAPVFQRAAERGELREGVDPIAAIKMFSAAYLFDVIFADTAVDRDYAAQLLDIFIHGITR